LKCSFCLDKNESALHEVVVVRFLGLLATLLLFAYGSVLAAGSAIARSGVPGEATLANATDSFEPGEERRQAQAPLPPTDVNDDDDDDGDDQEVFTEQTRVVPWQCPIALRASPQPETIRPSLGHPRGIDDPPRS
jgi:hypothetical protein